MPSHLAPAPVGSVGLGPDERSIADGKLRAAGDLPDSQPSHGDAARCRRRSRHDNPPTAIPARAPATSMIQPISGPPMGVDPMKATAHNAMTRPRIAGLASSWSVELPVDMNVMAANPVTPMATNPMARDGASATHNIAMPKPVPAMVIVLFRGGHVRRS